MKTASMGTLTLLVTLALPLGCGTDSGELPTAPARPALHLEADDAPQFSDWSDPVNLGPVVNSAGGEIEMFISRNGRSLYFASSRSGDFDIWVSQRSSVDDPWGPPQNLGPAINTTAREQAPFLSPDEHRMYFFSDRPGGFGGTDLYVSRRRDKHDDFGWQPPVNLGSGVNSAFNENTVVYFDDDATDTGILYFNSNRPGGVGGTDIYASTRQPDGSFGPAVLVAELSSPVQDAVTTIRRDGLELIMASTRPPAAAGLFDLLVATRPSTSAPWSAPLNLGPPINTAADEGRASLSFDATVLYLTSSRPGGSGGHDLWVSTRSRLGHDDDDEDDDDDDDDGNDRERDRRRGHR